VPLAPQCKSTPQLLMAHVASARPLCMIKAAATIRMESIVDVPTPGVLEAMLCGANCRLEEFRVHCPSFDFVGIRIQRVVSNAIFSSCALSDSV
jgi:hypothetical protein